MTIHPPTEVSAAATKADGAAGGDGAAGAALPVLAGRDASLAFDFLSPALRDPFAMARLRHFGQTHVGGASLTRLDDAQLLHLLCGAVAARRLPLAEIHALAQGSTSTAAIERFDDGLGTAPKYTPGATSSQPPPPPPAAPSRARAPAPEPTAPPVAPEIDAAAQAEALRAAAEDGTPFCEECEKARQAELA